jgi:hypothetical protein
MVSTLAPAVTCPSCGAATPETMPTDACLVFWNCPACGTQLKPKARLLRVLQLRERQMRAETGRTRVL